MPAATTLLPPLPWLLTNIPLLPESVTEKPVVGPVERQSVATWIVPRFSPPLPEEADVGVGNSVVVLTLVVVTLVVDVVVSPVLTVAVDVVADVVVDVLVVGFVAVSAILFVALQPASAIAAATAATIVAP